MSRSVVLTARKVPCPTCGAPRFEYCIDAHGNLCEYRSHPARVIAAREAPDLTPGHIEALRKLHLDPTRYIEPGMRIALLKRKLITDPDPPNGPHEHRQSKPPKRRHPLTDAGRAAIGELTQVASPATNAE
ncbi:MAG TPA: hypothetical protein VLN57_20915 [Xanthobacteraceae bacterium]|nr:hypothetical protein [Xanthobacteraceae bacterium]